MKKETKILICWLAAACIPWGANALAEPETPQVHFPDSAWPSRGSLLVAFQIEGMASTVSLGDRPEKMWAQYLVGDLLDCPLFRVELTARKENTSLKFTSHTDEGGSVNLLLSRLDGDKVYWLLVAWDVSAGRFDVNLNGIQQGDMDGWKGATLRLPDETRFGELLLSGRLEQSPGGQNYPIKYLHAERFPGPLRQAEVVQILAQHDVTPLSGEGRTVYSEGMDLSELELVEIFSLGKLDGIEIVNERDLFEGDVRTKFPPVDSFVLEGNGRVEVGPDRSLNLQTAEGSNDNHIVLWLPGKYPGNFLLEYDFQPNDDREGLHIVFFAASGQGQDGIHDLSRKKRDGIFSKYFAGDIDCYHASVFSAFKGSGFGDLRLSANLRKNSGFHLLAMGNDRIGGFGAGFHRIRIKKIGGIIEIETDGIFSLRYHDEGRTFGPALESGSIGLRLMGHSHGATIRNLKVFEIAPSDSTIPALAEELNPD